MCDVRAHLSLLVERVTASLMPSELLDVVRFLRRDDVLVAAPTHKNSSSSSSHTTTTTFAAATTTMTTTAMPPLCAPHGLLRWHDMLPLAIVAGGSLSLAQMSTSSSSGGGGNAALLRYFHEAGFARVLIIDLTHNANNNNDDGDNMRGDGDATTTHTLTPDDALCAMRQWCERIVHDAHAADAATTATTAAAARRVTASSDDVHPHRLLALVHCHANNRAGVSIATTSRRRHGGHAATANNNSSGSSSSVAHVGVKRHRYGVDALHTLLHDVAALARACNARLRVCTTRRVHMAVLLLPEDFVYGAVLLTRQLSHAVGDAFCLRLFAQHESSTRAHNDNDASTTTRGADGSNSSKRNTLCRVSARRVLRLWVPQLAHDATSHNAQTPASSSASSSQLLLSSSRYFFLRAQHAPLCCYLRDVLRCYPHLVHARVLRAWQRVWALRRSLHDVALAVHTTLMPFACTQSHTTDDDDDTVCSGNNNSNNIHAVTLSTRPRRVRRDASSVYADAADLIDAILLATDVALHNNNNTTTSDATDAHHNDDKDSDDNADVDEAVLFMLLYDELVRRCGTHVLRTPALVDALATMHARETRAQPGHRTVRDAQTTTTNDDGDGGSHDDARVRAASVALRCLLPYSRCGCVRVAHGHTDDDDNDDNNDNNDDEENDNDRDSDDDDVALSSLLLPPLPHTAVTAELQHTALTCVLSPAASLQQLRDAMARVAAHTYDVMHNNNNNAKTTGSSSSSDAGATLLAQTLSSRNFYSDAVPDAVRVLHVLTAHAVSVRRATHARTRNVAARHDTSTAALPLRQLRDVCALSDEQLLCVLVELHAAQCVAVDVQAQTARSLLYVH